MKKALIGILILIPIIILLVVSLATNILVANAHIAVEKLTIKNLQTNEEAFDLSFQLDDVKAGTIDLLQYVYVDIYPRYANSYTLEWRISGNVTYTDEKYEDEYNQYVAQRDELRKTVEEEVGSGKISSAHQEAYDISFGKYYYDTAKVVENMLDILLEVKYPAVALVDDNGDEANINTSGKLNVHSYCNFTVELSAENVSKTLSISVVGFDVEQVKLNRTDGKTDNVLKLGDSLRLSPSYTPIDSIVNKTVWSSSDESVAKVDENGVVKAVGVGSATIKLDAGVHSTEESDDIQYVSAEYEIQVETNGASSIFGSKLVTSKTSLSLDEIGLIESEISEVEGGEYKNGFLTISEKKARITLKDGRQLSIENCPNGAITIGNSTFFDKENGYILSVGENSLKLSAVWTDMLETSLVDGVTWTSSDENIATVDNSGNVVGISDGVVTITAKRAEFSCAIQLNVRKKLSSIQLRTSDASLSIGLARETVFASNRYDTSDVNNTHKVENFVYVIVQGQPNSEDYDVLKAFYSAYDFEIVSGGEYAYFDNNEVNKLVFKSSLEGKGKQNIVVRVKAKYPKYETNTRFTQEDVTIKAVFGVEVNDIIDARRAVYDQREYAMADDNVIEGKLVFEHYGAEDGERYFVNTAPKSKQLYAMVFASSFGYELDEYGNAENTIGYDNNLIFYGDVYGNNNIFSAKRQQISTHLFRVMWSGVTISNCVFRANDIGKEGSLTSAEDTTGFSGNVCEVISADNDENGQGGTRVEDVVFEYSIIENAKTGVSIFNADVQLKGCIIRNLTKAGVYAPARMLEYQKGFIPWYVHLDLHNVICSNTLGSFMSVAYEAYTVEKGSNGNVGRFIKDDLVKNEEYFIENFYNKGINIEVNQTGFLETYNWQNLKNATLISTGETWADNLIGSVAGDMLDSLSYFDKFKYVEGDQKYVHMGFIVSGVGLKQGIMDAPTYLKLNMADDRFHEIDVPKIIDLDELGNTDGLILSAGKLLKDMSVKMYCYDNECSLTPFTTYQVNALLVERLHG